MAQQRPDSGQQVLNLILIGFGAWLLWEFVISPMMASQHTTTTGTQLPQGYCFDMNGQVVQCSAGTATGSTVAVTTTTNPPVPTPTTQNATGTQPNVVPNVASRMTPAQQAAISQRRALVTTTTKTNPLGGPSGGSTRGTAGIAGIVPSWVSSGGPAFSNFVPGGMTFGGQNAFGSPAAAFVPTTKLVQ